MWPGKYPRTRYWPWSPSVPPGDRRHADPERFVGREVVVTEKVDGALACLVGGEAFPRSMTAPGNAPWLAMVRKHHAWKLRGCDDAIYGEDLYGVHAIEYAPTVEEETFRVFAVRRRVSGADRLASWDETERVAAAHGMPLVPVLFRGRFDSTREIGEFFAAEIGKPSALGGPEREGFVLRDASGFSVSDFAATVAKHVRPNHVQTDLHWTRNWRPCRLRRRS